MQFLDAIKGHQVILFIELLCNQLINVFALVINSLITAFVHNLIPQHRADSNESVVAQNMWQTKALLCHE